MSRRQITTEIDLSDFDVDEIIDEVESRGYVVSDENLILEEEELDWLLSNLPDVKIGSKPYFIKEKLMKQREYDGR